jgi:putative FmdB family regulatory protein
MPVYEYLCRTCDTRFEARRPMAEAGSPLDCPAGHHDTTRLLSVFASVGRGPQAPAPGAGGGGCGPGCACAS